MPERWSVGPIAPRSRATARVQPARFRASVSGANDAASPRATMIRPSGVVPSAARVLACACPSFVAGTGASDDLFVQVSDGQANSNLAEFHVNINHAPVVTVAEMSAHAGQTLQAGSLFGAADADNDALIYTFQDSTPDPAIEDYAPAVHTGYFVVNGTVIAAGTSFSVSAAQLANNRCTPGQPPRQPSAIAISASHSWVCQGAPAAV